MTNLYDDEGYLPCKDDPDCPCTHRKCEDCELPDHPFISCSAAESIHTRTKTEVLTGHESLVQALDTGFLSLPAFKSEMEAALHAVKLYEEHKNAKTFVYFTSGGPMHPAPPTLVQEIHKVADVFVLATAGCSIANYETQFNGVYNALSIENWSMHSARSKVVRWSLIKAFMNHYYADCGGDIFNNSKRWAEKYLWPDSLAFSGLKDSHLPDGRMFYEYEREKELRDLTESLRMTRRVVPDSGGGEIPMKK